MKKTKKYYITLKTDLFEKGDFINYHSVSDLLRFLRFIDEKYPNWKFFHVWDKKGGEKLETFKKTREVIYIPTTRTL